MKSSSGGMSENVFWNSQWRRLCATLFCIRRGKAMEIKELKQPSDMGACPVLSLAGGGKVSSGSFTTLWNIVCCSLSMKWGELRYLQVFSDNCFSPLGSFILWVSPFGPFLNVGGIPALLRWDGQSSWALVTGGSSSGDRRCSLQGLQPPALPCCTDISPAHNPLRFYALKFRSNLNLS